MRDTAVLVEIQQHQCEIQHSSARYSSISRDAAVPVRDIAVLIRDTVVRVRD